MARLMRSLCGPNPKAFTIIELLVAIGIIGVLAATLLPVFAKVRAKSRETVCIANLHQIGAAMLLYSEDYESHFPYAGDAPDIYGNDLHTIPGGSAVNRLQPLTSSMSSYMKDKRLWHCPSDTGYLSTGFTNASYPFNTRPSTYGRFGNSYAYYTELAIGHYSVSTLRATSTYSMVPDRFQADIVAFSDGSASWHGSSASQCGRYSSLFVDGHIKSLTQAEYTDAYSIVLNH